MGSGFLAALATLAGPIVARVLIALGMSVVTITGVELSIQSVRGLIVSNLGAAPLAILQLAGLSGCWNAIGMMFGGVTFAVGYWTLTQATQVLGKR